MTVNYHSSLTREEQRFNDSVILVKRRWYQFPRRLKAVPFERRYETSPSEVEFAIGQFICRRQIQRDFMFRVKVGSHFHLVTLYFRGVTDLPRYPFRFGLQLFRNLLEWGRDFLHKKRVRRRRDVVFKKDTWYRFPEPLREVPTLPTHAGISFNGRETDEFISFQDAEYIAPIPLAGEHIFRARIADHWHYIALAFDEDEPLPEEIPPLAHEGEVADS